MSKLRDVSRYLFCILLLVFIFCVFGLRLIDWQIINGEEWLKVSAKTNTSTVKMPAARGEILDAKGNPLAVNKTGYAIVFDKAYMTDETQNRTILQLTTLLDKRKEKWIDELPIQLSASGTYEFVPGREKDVDFLKKYLFRGNTYVTAEQCVLELEERYDCKGYSAAQTRAILSVRYNMQKSGFSVSTPYTFASDVSDDTIGIISENAQNLPGATVQVTTVRQYPDGLVAPHVVGTIGSLSQEEYQQFKDEDNLYGADNPGGYAYNDTLGKSGIEQAFEDQLRGKSGTRVVETTRTGALASSKVTQAPVSGNTVYLTIDSNLQKVAQASLAKNVQEAQAYGKSQVAKTGKSGYGEDCIAGGAVVLNVKDFSVLAAATYPSYDLSKYMSDSAYYLSLINDPTKPLYNRALNGSFMPGSAFKPVVAAAALQENVINQSSTVVCHHVYTFWDDYQPTCMGYHGTTNVLKGLQKSCNIFFFDVGRRLGIESMDLYAKRFGLGQKTGIEISEGKGTLASPATRAAAGGTWQGGDVVQAAIGQADNSFTPLQLATYVATIANNGVRLKTHLVSKVTDYSRKNIVQENDPEKPQVMDNVNVSQKNLDIVKKGMREVVQPGGTAASFANYGIAIAGKTGTAENPPHSDNTVFVAFAPYENPEIAVAVVLEYGATGKFSTAVARDIFDAYFFGKTVDKDGNLVTPSEKTDSDSASSSASSTEQTR